MSRGSAWTFLTNHAHVLICVARDPGIRVRDVAETVGITERAAHGIISDLVEAGYLRREKSGRRNVYECVEDMPLRHPVEREHLIGELLATLTRDAPTDVPARHRRRVDPNT
ncbi:helix-turn-helix transcriptional regulator [Lysobacter korlensis]|uniref:Helix-turn-helix transcriptional regulator n=1 Tax=Lysobacter korlensis TaxID=553636 RepID=A0ABV6S0C5_9GAMM